MYLRSTRQKPSPSTPGHPRRRTGPKNEAVVDHRHRRRHWRTSRLLRQTSQWSSLLAQPQISATTHHGCSTRSSPAHTNTNSRTNPSEFSPSSATTATSHLQHIRTIIWLTWHCLLLRKQILPWMCFFFFCIRQCTIVSKGAWCICIRLLKHALPCNASYATPRCFADLDCSVVLVLVLWADMNIMKDHWLFSSAWSLVALCEHNSDVLFSPDEDIFPKQPLLIVEFGVRAVCLWAKVLCRTVDIAKHTWNRRVLFAWTSANDLLSPELRRSHACPKVKTDLVNRCRWFFH